MIPALLRYTRRVHVLALLGLCVFGLLAGRESLAAIAYVQSASVDPNTSAATSLTVTYGTAQTADDLNVVAVGWSSATVGISSVTDSSGNSYTLAAGPTVGTDMTAAIYYAPNIVAATAGANTVTVTFSAAVAFPDVRIAEYSGISTSNPVDVTAASTGDSANTSSGSVSTSNANDLLIGSNYVATGTTGPGTGFTQRIITGLDGSILEDEVVSSMGAYAATAPISPSDMWIMQLVAFRGASSSGGDTTPPTVPSNLTSTAASSSQINLSWSASTDNVGVTGYLVERCQGAACTNFTQIGTPTGTAYSDMGLTASTSYTYRVRATDAAGLLSSYSATTSATTQSVAIAYVQGNSINPKSKSTTSLTVSYTTAQTAGDLNVVAVGWGSAAVGIGSVTDSNGNSYTLAAGPTVGTGMTAAIYYAPNIAAATAGANTVTVTFSAAVPFPDVRIAEYSGISTSNPLDVTAGSTGNSATTSSGSVSTSNANDLLVGSNYVAVATTGPGTGFTQRIITGLDGNILEDEVVSTTGAYAATAPISSSGAWVMQLAAFRGASSSGGDTTPPTAPSGLTATAASSSQINLGWTASTDNVAVTGYLVERCQGAACTNFTQIATSTAVTFSDSGLAAATSYSYRVRATDGSGNLSTYSSTATVTTPSGASIPPTPVNVQVNAANSSSSQISLTWAAVAGATGYLVQRCQGTGCTNFAQVATPTTNSYTDTGLASQTSYSYQIAATNAAGQSAFSSVISTATQAGPDTTAPTIPSGLSTIATSNTQINLTWTPSTDNVAVSGYLVESCQGAGCSNFAQIGAVTINAFNATGLTAASVYSFRVRATDAANNLSGYSNISSASTPAAGGAAAAVRYDYDALGRLIQVELPSLSSVQAYSYDAAGNITSSPVSPIGSLSVGGLSAQQGSAGSQITIYGSGFSTTTSGDAVTINGVSATVVSATSTQLVIMVPAGATSGSIVVQVGGSSVTFSTSFTVTPAAGSVTITGISPALAAVGTTIAMTGSGFDPVRANNKLLFSAGGAATPSANTTTTLTVVVPSGAWSGKVRLATPRGIASSTVDFFTPPSGYTVAAIGSTGRMVTGTPAVITLPAAGQSSLQIFDGNVGDLLAIGASAVTISTATVKIFSPDGHLLTSGTITASGQGIQLPPLLLAGTYAVVIDPASNTGAVTLTLVSPTPGTLTSGGAPLPLALTPPGQRAIVTFSATAAQYLTLAFTGDTIPSATVTIFKPDGSSLLSTTVTPSTTGVQLPQIQVAGTYTIRVDPGSGSGNLTLALLTPITGTVAVGGSPLSLSLSPTGQRALVTFSGTAGQYLTLMTGQSAGFTGTVTVITPAGATLASAAFAPGGSAYFMQLPALPTSGSYTILADPGNSTSGLALQLLGTVAVSDSGPNPILLPSLAARGQINFTGTPGQFMTVAIQEGQRGDDQNNYISGIKITVVAPDGSILNGTSLLEDPPENPTYSFECGQGGFSTCYGESVLNLGPFPTYAAGTTYTVLIEPTGQTPLGCCGGTLTYSVWSPLVSSTPVVANGGPVQYFFAITGRGILVPVTLAAGKSYALTISESSGNLPNVEAVVLNSQGQAIQGAGVDATCSSPCTPGTLNAYSGTNSSGIGVGISGNYMILLQQTTQTSGSNAYPPLTGFATVELTTQ